MKQRKIGLIAPYMIAASIGVDGFGGLWRHRVSGKSIRNDPDRQKTPADLAAIELAKAKRERKHKRTTCAEKYISVYPSNRGQWMRDAIAEAKDELAKTKEPAK